MSAEQIIDLDPKDFKLNDYDNVRITMPAKPAMTEDDVDAQLFEYVLSGGTHIKSIADLDDEWVKANFEGLETIEDVRQAIKDDYDRSIAFEQSDIKFQECCKALIARLEGEIPQEAIDHNVEVTRAGNLERLAEMHLTMEQYLSEENMTTADYEAKLVDEVAYQMRLNVALDIMADVLGAQVGNHEITEYLSTPNPQAFLEEIREKNLVENARRAAVRVKVMRRVVDTAIVTEIDENGNVVVKEAEASAPAQPRKGTEGDADSADEQMPDFEHLPAPQISNSDRDTWQFGSESAWQIACEPACESEK